VAVAIPVADYTAGVIEGEGSLDLLAGIDDIVAVPSSFFRIACAVDELIGHRLCRHCYSCGRCNQRK